MYACGYAYVGQRSLHNETSQKEHDDPSDACIFSLLASTPMADITIGNCVPMAAVIRTDCDA